MFRTITTTARIQYKNNYTKINFKDTKNAYRLLNDNKLKKQQQIYKLFNMFSKNENMGQKAITTFMNTKPPLIYPVIQNKLFDQFCGGEDLDSLTPLIKNIKNNNVTPMLNYGVEYSTKEEDLDNCKDEMINMIKYLDKQKMNNLKGQSIIRVTGVMSHNRLRKIQNGYAFNSLEKDLWKKDLSRLENICEYAVAKKVKLLFDAETIDIQTIIHNLSLQMMQRFNGNKPRIYGTIQFYRKDSHEQLNRLLKDGHDNKYIPGLKLVRGAYIHDETLAGRRHLLHDTKFETDKSYNEGVTVCLNNIDSIAVCFAGHNTNTVKHIISGLISNDIPAYSPNIMLAQMQGMRNDITFNLSDVNVSQFIPYGKKNFLFPYLVRRGIENSSALGGSKEELRLITKEIKRRKDKE
jgi:proline dehydrogenase